MIVNDDRKVRCKLKRTLRSYNTFIVQATEANFMVVIYDHETFRLQATGFILLAEVCPCPLI